MTLINDRNYYTPALTRRTVLATAAGAAGALAAARVPLAAAAPPGFARVPLEPAGWSRSGAWLLSPVLRRGPFELAGLSWRGGAEAGAQLRARTPGGWTAWAHLHRAGDHGPDRPAHTRATDPVWTGRADALQIRLRRAVPGLEAHLVDGGRRRSPEPRAQSSQGRPRIISRSEWGGDQYPPRNDPSFGEVKLAFVHHTVTANDYRPEDSAGIVRSICAYHRNTNKWSDLGYNFLVDRYGQVFEGRAGGVELAVIGAQAQGYNSVSTGIACIGTFEEGGFDGAGIDALASLIAWKLPLHGVPVTGHAEVRSAGGSQNRYPEGRTVTFERISGHRDGNSTACPGDALYRQLPRIRELAASRQGPIAAPEGKPSVTIAADAPEVVFGGKVRVSGSVRTPDGSSPDGLALELQARAPGGGWKRAKPVRAAADGSWLAHYRPESEVELRAVVSGRATEAQVVAVALRPAISIAASRRKLTAGDKLSVRGGIKPGAGPLAIVVEQRQADGSYRSFSKQRVAVRRGRYRADVRLGPPALYRVRARFGGDRKLSKSRSEAIYARVRPVRGAAGGQPSG